MASSNAKSSTGGAGAKGFRQSMAWLHTWSGLLPGWVLYLVFLTGTIAFFNTEITHWMKPELPSGPASPQAIEAAETLLRSRAPAAESWFVTLPSERGSEFEVGWVVRDGDFTGVTLDPRSGAEIVARETRGGHFFYRFHFDFHYMPVLWARYIVSIASLAMLVAIISGIVTHKKIFTDFFLLRFGKGQRSWLDAHNVAGVLALPFHLMITYTGLVIFSYLLIPSVIGAHYEGRRDYFDEAFPHVDAEPSGRPAPTLKLADLFARAEALTGAPPGGLSIHSPGDAGALIEIEPQGTTFPHPRTHLYLNGATGEVAHEQEPSGPATQTHGVMVDLHAGRLSGPVLRWLYFLAGVLGTAMMVTGLILWTVKRRAKLPDPERPHLGFRLVERLNIGVIAGSMAGVPVYFLANRMLPLGMENRAHWEIHSFFIAWAAVFVWSLARPTKTAWLETIAVGGLLYALVPIVSAATTGRSLVASLVAGDWIFVSFDLTMLATAALMGLAAWKLAHRKPVAIRRTRREATA